MSDVVGAPYGAKQARQVKSVARAVLALTVAVGLVGCDNTGEKRTATDEQGCKWTIEAFHKRDGSLSTGTQFAHLNLSADGKPMCGAP